jgi:tRNA dimethylallyltransferase
MCHRDGLLDEAGRGVQPGALLLAGPTASGKSALALALAERLGGEVINADSMQLYAELRVLTARPSAEEEARAPHALYGVRPAREAASVAWWREAALAAMARAHAAGRLPIVTGGTGLYFAALTEGFSEMPPIPEAVRAEARERVAREGPAALHAALDAETAARLRPTDSQRIARAYEVWRATGRGLASWQAERGAPAPWRFAGLRLDPPREGLREAIRARWAAMLARGAVEEVRALLALGLEPSLPAMRAHGVPEIGRVLRGEWGMAEAGERACLAIGQYVKRQATWWRHRALAGRTHIIHARVAELAQFSESERAEIFAFVEAAR